MLGFVCIPVLQCESNNFCFFLSKAPSLSPRGREIHTKYSYFSLKLAGPWKSLAGALPSISSYVAGKGKPLKSLLGNADNPYLDRKYRLGLQTCAIETYWNRRCGTSREWLYRFDEIGWDVTYIFFKPQYRYKIQTDVFHENTCSFKTAGTILLSKKIRS